MKTAVGNMEVRRAVWESLQDLVGVMQEVMRRNRIASIRSVHSNYEGYDDEFVVTWADGKVVTDGQLEEIEPDLENLPLPVLSRTGGEEQFKWLDQMYEQKGFAVFVSGVMDVLNDFVLNTPQEGDFIDRVDIDVSAYGEVEIAMQQENVIAWSSDYAGIAERAPSATALGM